jgi:PAS domain S-box-containing protein
VTHAATVRVPVASGAPAPWPLGWAALLLGVLYYFGARIGFLLTPSPAPVSTLWPPNAILLAALALSGVRRWPALLVAALLAHVAVELQSGVPLPMVLSWFVSNSTEALVGAIGMRRLMHDNIRLDTVRRVGIFVLFAGVIAPLVSSFLDAAFVQWNNWGSGTYWTVWRDRFFSNVLAILAIVPVAITWRNRGVQFIRSVTAWRAFEATLLVLGLLAVVRGRIREPGQRLRIGAGDDPGADAFPALGRVRFGPAGSSFCLLIFALLSIWGAMQGFGPFAGHPMAENILPLQLFLILTYIPILGLTAVIKERASAVEVARSSEERLNLALSAAQIRTWDWDIGSKAWSDKANEVLGITSEVLGIPANGSGAAPNGSDAVSAGDRASVRAAIARAIERGTPYEAEFRIDRPDGSSQWVLGKGTVVTDRVGRPARMIGVNVDVTERKRAEIALRDEASLRESEARFRELADAMPQVVFTARPTARSNT